MNRKFPDPAASEALLSEQSGQPSLQYRQGDVLLVRVDAPPANAEVEPRVAGRIVLAHGEATGHTHAIPDAAADLLSADFRSERGQISRRFLVVRGSNPVALVHEEHATLRIVPGVYEVRRQVEYGSLRGSRALTRLVRD